MYCSRQMNRKINHIHERALRLVYNDYSSTFNQLLIKDNTVSIHHRNIQYMAIEMFKITNDLCPPMMKEIFRERKTSHRSGVFYTRPKVNTVYKGDNYFSCFGPRVWNEMLPDKYKACNTLAEFKNAIKSWKPENCPCRLCKQYIPGLGFI